MFLNRNLNQRMPKNPLKEIANKRQELVQDIIASPFYPRWYCTRPHRGRL